MDEHLQSLYQKSLKWSLYSYGIKTNPIRTIADVTDDTMRSLLQHERIVMGQQMANPVGEPRKYWFDNNTNTLNIVLENFKDEIELDTVLLRQVVSRVGLQGLLGRKGCEDMGLLTFNNLRPEQQRTLLAQFSGNPDILADRSSAGRRYIISAARFIPYSNDQEKAFNHWFWQVENRIKPFNRPLLDNLILHKDRLADIIASALREGNFITNALNNTNLDFKESIIKLYDADTSGKTIDRRSFISLGLPSTTLLSSASWTHNYPVVLPMTALYGQEQDYGGERFVNTADFHKRDKHPFSILSLLSIKKDLDVPLAVFKSRGNKTRRDLLVMAATRTNVKNETTGNLCIPIGQKEVLYLVDDKSNVNLGLKDGHDSGNDTLKEKKGTGLWVNLIKSIYPKSDLEYLSWLAKPGLATYLAPDFIEKWFKPVTKRLQKEFEAKFSAMGIPVPSEKDVEDYWRTHPVYSTLPPDKKYCPDAGGDLDRAGLLFEYAVFKTAEESATKVVRNFENPKEISENIEFSIKKSLSDNYSDEYALATKATIFFANNLQEKAGIEVVVISDREALRTLGAAQGRSAEPMFKLSDGTIYGYQLGNTIYLTPKGINPNTPIHEYGHIWAKVYEKLHPEEWETLKGELRSTLIWQQLSASDDYTHIAGDENRLAGEVLAHMIGDKGEELQLAAAREVLAAGGSVDDETSVEETVARFREKVTTMAVKDVFGAEGMERTGEVTLKVLQDFAEGRGVQISEEEGEKLAAMAKKTTDRERNDAVAGNSSSIDLTSSRQGASKPSSPNSTVDVANLQQNTEFIKRKCQKYQNEHDVKLDSRDENGIVRALAGYFKLDKSKSSLSFYQDVYEGTVSIGSKTVRVRISNHPANHDRVYASPTDDFVSIVIYKNGETTGSAPATYSETTYHLSQMSPDRIVDSVACGIGDLLRTGVFLDKYGKFDTVYFEDGKIVRRQKKDSPDETNFSMAMNKHEHLHDTLKAHLYDYASRLAIPQTPSRVGVDKDGNIVCIYGIESYRQQFTGGYEASTTVREAVFSQDDKLIRERFYKATSYGNMTMGPEVEYYPNGGIRSYREGSFPVGTDDQMYSERYVFNEKTKELTTVREGDFSKAKQIEEIQHAYDNGLMKERSSDIPFTRMYESKLVEAAYTHVVQDYEVNLTPYLQEQILDAVRSIKKDFILPQAIINEEYGRTVIAGLVEKNIPGEIHVVLSEALEDVRNSVFLKGPDALKATNIDTPLNNADSFLRIDKEMPGTPILESIVRAYAETHNLPIPISPADATKMVEDALRESKMTFTAGELHPGEQQLPLSEQVALAAESGKIEVGDKIAVKKYYAADSNLNIYIVKALDHLNVTPADIVLASPSIYLDKKDQVLDIIDKNGIKSTTTDVPTIEALRAFSSLLEEKLPQMNLKELSEVYRQVGHMVSVIDKASSDDTTKLILGDAALGRQKEILDSVNTKLKSHIDIAHKEVSQFISRGYRTENTFIDRILRRTFNPTHPMLSIDDILPGKEKGEFAYMGMSADEMKAFADKFQALAPLFQNRMEQETVRWATGIISQEEIKDISKTLKDQLELTGRIDGPFTKADGAIVVVQKDGDSLITMEPELIRRSLNGTISINGKSYTLNESEKTGLSYGVGQYLTDTKGERVYVAYDIKKQAVVKAEPFDKINRERCSAKASFERKAAQKKETKQAQDKPKTKSRGRK